MTLSRDGLQGLAFPLPNLQNLSISQSNRSKFHNPLSLHPPLSLPFSLISLSFLLPPDLQTTTPTIANFSDQFLLIVSTYYSRLHSLRFLAGPVSRSPIVSLSSSCTHITSLSINLYMPLFLNWFVCQGEALEKEIEGNMEDGFSLNDDFDAELGIERLCVLGIRSDDLGLGWVWRSYTKLKKLQLHSCEGIGDGGSFSSFIMCLKAIEEVELRTCRSIVDGVLLKLVENYDSLTSLLVYDGRIRDGILRFFSHCSCNKQKLDLRLPLDLNNDHLLAAAVNFRTLSSLRLQSCCLVRGEGLKALGVAMSSELEELALINCDVVEREMGLLATLGQNLKQLKKLDLSYNEMLLDKEFVSMLVSCYNLVDLKLRGCKGLTNLALTTMSKSCKRLENVDIMSCYGIEAEAIELLIRNSPNLSNIFLTLSRHCPLLPTFQNHKK
ncbi:hypothetical protein UlMin_025996 [Ulmus minor]